VWSQSVHFLLFYNSRERFTFISPNGDLRLLGLLGPFAERSAEQEQRQICCKNIPASLHARTMTGFRVSQRLHACRHRSTLWSSAIGIVIVLAPVATAWLVGGGNGRENAGASSALSAMRHPEAPRCSAWRSTPPVDLLRLRGGTSAGEPLDDLSVEEVQHQSSAVGGQRWNTSG